VVGIAKAYTTRVGNGPFPTEWLDARGEAIRQKGQEYGATTGRPRRCGALDLVVLRHAARVNGLTEWAVTKLDVLSGTGPIPVAVAYEANGRRYEDFPADDGLWSTLKPVYEEMPGWEDPLHPPRVWDDLPLNARRYLERIHRDTGVPIGLVSWGPDREQTIVLRHPFG